MKKFFYIFVFLFISFSATSQDIINIRLGIFNPNTEIDNLRMGLGYEAGISSRLGIPGLFISPGVYYQYFYVEEYNGKKFTDNKPTYHVMKLNINSGFEYAFMEILSLRAYVGANVNYLGLAQNNRTNSDLYSIRDLFFSYNFGLGTTVSIISLDFKFEKTFDKLYNSIPESNLNLYTVSLGVVF